MLFLVPFPIIHIVFFNAEASIENNVKRKEYTGYKSDAFVFMTLKVSRLR
jgi:hypothetical protein